MLYSDPHLGVACFVDIGLAYGPDLVLACSFVYRPELSSGLDLITERCQAADVNKDSVDRTRAAANRYLPAPAAAAAGPTRSALAPRLIPRDSRWLCAD